MMKRKQKRWYRGGSWWRKIRMNRKHKDKLFRYLFKDKRHLLDLYNALHETDYADPEELEVKKEKSEVLRMIFLTEYDEKKHMRHVFEDGREEGREEKLLEQICKKLAKGKGMEQIAEELEEDIETIRRLSRNEEHHGRQDRN